MTAADHVLDPRDVVVGQLQARAGGGLEVDGELSGVGLGEESAADERIDEEAGGEQAEDGQHA